MTHDAPGTHPFSSLKRGARENALMTTRSLPTRQRGLADRYMGER
jgi:hypothetical protein